MEPEETQSIFPALELSAEYVGQRELTLDRFESWTGNDQFDFLKNLLILKFPFQNEQINEFLMPMLQRDFISLMPKEKGVPPVAEKILSYLDGRSLSAAELVSKEWKGVIAGGMLWKKLIERKVRSDTLWRALGERRGWVRHLFNAKDGARLGSHLNHSYYRVLYQDIIKDIERLETNWLTGDPKLQFISCNSAYCLQYGGSEIVTGHHDGTIFIWNLEAIAFRKVFIGHTGSVMCLQYDEEVIISGSRDSTVRVWDIKTITLLNTLTHHSGDVRNLRFKNGMLITCSSDGTIAVLKMESATNIKPRHVLVGHTASVNAVDFDEKYIISASDDKTIKVWSTSSCEFVRTLQGHSGGILCLHYRDNLVMSGSVDNTIRIWNIVSGVCLRVLEGHDGAVRSVRFNNKRIVSGAHDGNIKIWDFQATLDPGAPASSLCLRTLKKYTQHLLALQMDEFQIVSSSWDGTILVSDFFNIDQPVENQAN